MSLLHDLLLAFLPGTSFFIMGKTNFLLFESPDDVGRARSPKRIHISLESPALGTKRELKGLD